LFERSAAIAMSAQVTTFFLSTFRRQLKTNPKKATRDYVLARSSF